MWGGGLGQTNYKTVKNKYISQYADKYPHSSSAYGAWAADFFNAAKESGKTFCMSVSFKASHMPFTPDVYFYHVYDAKKYEKPANYGAQNALHIAPRQKRDASIMGILFGVIPRHRIRRLSKNIIS